MAQYHRIKLKNKLLIFLMFFASLKVISQYEQKYYSHNNVVDSLDKTDNENFINRAIEKVLTSNDSLKSPPKIKFGGAVRINYAWKDYDDQNKDKTGEFGFELFRLNADIDYKDIFLSVEYRWYDNFYAVRYGYFGYHVNNNLSFQIGVHQVPFGMNPYASHSFWFNATYYLGFEDDYDAGIKFIYQDENWNLQAAFYKNAEYNDSKRYGRYSFDLVTDDVQTNEEINQWNLRSIYKWKTTKNLVMNIGLSGEYGEIYNQTTNNMGDRYAIAVHNNAYYKNWNLQLQWINYEYRPNNPENISPKTIQFGAFMYPFMVTSKANVYTINLAKDFHINGKYIDKIKIYSDLSMVNPKKGYGSNSKQFVLGTTIIKRGLYAYFDYIMGQNMWFSGGPGIGLMHPDDENWNSRLNINIGYYF